MFNLSYVIANKKLKETSEGDVDFHVFLGFWAFLGFPGVSKYRVIRAGSPGFSYITSSKRAVLTSGFWGRFWSFWGSGGRIPGFRPFWALFGGF